VPAARGPDALHETADECRRAGASVVTVATDVRDPEAVQRLAQVAADTFDGIGVWVSNAGTGAVGRFWEVPLEAHRRTIETNLLGAVHGAHAALPHFLRQGRGVLINVNSIGGFVPTPYASAYAASKAGLRAFSDSLRRELAGFPSVHVCDVFPYFMDTPGVQHAANYTGRALKPAPIVDAPEHTAEIIVRLAAHPRPRTVVGPLARLARLGHAVAPAPVEWGLARAIEAYLAGVAAPAPITEGSMFEPMRRPMEVHGGWRRPDERLGAVAGLGLVAVGLAAWMVLGWRRPAHLT
jgi:short-subunit dehydrogenase